MQLGTFFTPYYLQNCAVYNLKKCRRHRQICCIQTGLHTLLFHLLPFTKPCFWTHNFLLLLTTAPLQIQNGSRIRHLKQVLPIFQSRKLYNIIPYERHWLAKRYIYICIFFFSIFLQTLYCDCIPNSHISDTISTFLCTKRETTVADFQWLNHNSFDRTIIPQHFHYLWHRLVRRKLTSSLSSTRSILHYLPQSMVKVARWERVRRIYRAL